MENDNNSDNVYADNGVVFIYDSTNEFHGFTYLGEELF